MIESAPSNSTRALAGLLGGLAGGLLHALFVAPELTLGAHLVLSVLLGLIFGLLSGSRVMTAGSGLIWGAAFGLIWWLAGHLTLIPLLEGQSLPWTAAALREAFPYLVGNVLCFGSGLGLSFYLFAGITTWLSSLRGKGRGSEAPGPPVSAQVTREGAKKTSGTEGLAISPVGQSLVAPRVQAIIVGALGGMAGSWVFLRGIERAEFYPLVASLVGSQSMMVGGLLHYAIGGTIGLIFGLLFYRDVKGAGPGLIWGMAYGLAWWVIGTLSLATGIVRNGTRPDWSLAAAQGEVPALVAHMLYGAMVGLFYALANRIWQALFVDSDPINRSREGVGTRGLRGILMGQTGGILGGLLFAFVFAGIDAFPQVAGLVGARSPVAGFLVHMTIAVIVGSTFGILFQHETSSYGAGMAWGMLYGMLWWLIGSNTLFNILLRVPVDWSLVAVSGRYPSLIGHLLYGAGLGLYYSHLARKHDIRWRSSVPRVRQRLSIQNNHPAGSSAPALWAVMLALGVLMLLLLAGSSSGMGY